MLIAVKNVLTRFNGWLAMPILRKSHAPFTLADAHGHWQPDGRTGPQSANWGPNGGGGTETIQIQDMRNAKSLNVTIAIHKSRFVEFTVKPTKQ